MLTKNGLVVWALAVVVLICGYLYVQTLDARDRAREADLRADSTAAANDTTRLVFEGTISGLKDSVKVFQRRAVQSELEKDDLDRMLGEESVARVNAELTIANLVAHLSGDSVTVDEDDVRSSTFFHETDLFSLVADIRLPPPPAEGIGDFNVTFKPFNIHARLTCKDSDTDIKEASLIFATPPDINLVLTDIEQEPWICNPQLYEKPGWFFGMTIPTEPFVGIFAGAAAGFVVDQSMEGAIGGALIGGSTGFVIRELLGWALD